MKTLSRIATTFILSSLLISAPTSAAPDGSLRKMLDTDITLIEYITLITHIESVQRLATGQVTKWGDYSSVVDMRVLFLHDDSKLRFSLTPVDVPYFSTVAEAKSHCRDLIRAERVRVLVRLFTSSKPNGWTTDGLNERGFRAQLYENTIIYTFVARNYIEEELPEEENGLRCKAYLDDEGEIKNFSYNL